MGAQGSMAADRAAALDAIGRMFVSVPDEALVAAFAQAMAEELPFVANDLSDQPDKVDASTLQLVFVDRTRLMRGYDTSGPKPPYQSLYDGRPAAEVCERLQMLYRDSGFALTDEVKEAPDYLGVELLFAAALYRLAAERAESDNRADFEEAFSAAEAFRNDTLHPFVEAYADTMTAEARTSFFRHFADFMRKAVE